MKNRRLVRDRFEQLIELCMDNTGLARPDYVTFRESLRYLAGEKLREGGIEILAQRLAGNIQRLRDGHAVRPWSKQTVAEWVPVQALSVQRVPHDKWGVAARLTLKILAGSPCPAVCRVLWSVKRCRVLARDLGFRQYGRRRDDPPPFPYAVPEELTTFRWEMLVDPDLSEREPVLTDFRVRPALQQWNRQQLKRRMRIDFACMANHPPNFPCWECSVGYLACPAGTHRHNWKVKKCHECGDAEALWDYELSRANCIACYLRDLHRRR